MAQARFSIGIDLGTTNCAVAFEALDETSSRTEIFPVSQLETSTLSVESTTLPSFLYLPPQEGAQPPGPDPSATAERWIPGRLARKKAAESPGRVAHSAKSWLCHHSVDRTAQFLPWRSDEIPPVKRISPIQASALLLEYLRSSWETRFPDFHFNDQEITITVPASFDAAAQALTLQAAAQAGYPERVRLLEEPQAAFYCWLEDHDFGTDATRRAEGHVLVVDIGGGTTDLSLFEISHRANGVLPRIKRVAVSDHLLLGGDNIDLAIAHRLESRLSNQSLSPAQWNFLVARCRDLKERCFSDASIDIFPVAVPARGSAILGGTLSGRMDRSEIESIVLDGFFPDCALESKPDRSQAGLREWALPYAADSRVTHYLAEFLRQRPRIDAVLFNGGSLSPDILRLRLIDQIARWQNGVRPGVLDNSEPGLAVARGAARFGKIVFNRSLRIEADAARSLYLEVHKRQEQKEKNPTLLCILAQNSPTEEEFQISGVGLELRLNRPVRFQAYSSTRRSEDKIGGLVTWNQQDFRHLPSLQTTARLTSGGFPGDRLPVNLRTCINELGILRIVCSSTQPGVRETWPLEFNLRTGAPEHPQGGDAEAESATRFDPAVEPARLENAKTRIAKVFSQPLNNRDKLTASNLFKSLERIIDAPKAGWNWGLVRSLWQTLAACHPDRSRSLEHDETWLILAGFFLRPGFGGDGDESRVDTLWDLQNERPANPAKRIQIQQFVLWRRVAGGLEPDRQNEIVLREMPRLAAPRNAPPELIRLAGAMEQIDPGARITLFKLFLAAATELAAAKQPCTHYLSSLGLFLNRAPFCAKPEVVLPGEYVEQAFNALGDFEWAEPDLGEFQTLFLRAARVVDDPKIDLPKSLRQKISDRLEKSGVTPTKLSKIRSFVPIATADRAGLFGEALPPGLVLRE